MLFKVYLCIYIFIKIEYYISKYLLFQNEYKDIKFIIELCLYFCFLVNDNVQIIL